MPLANCVKKQLKDGIAPQDIKVKFSLPDIRNLSAGWCVKAYNHLLEFPVVLKNGWDRCGL